MTVYVDTHVLVWIAKGEDHHLSSSARESIENDDLVVSPAVMLELELLHEIGRLRASAEKTFSFLESEIGLSVCIMPFHEVVTHALKEKSGPAIPSTA
jgi:PIN domain nuclease of toxin-antitoxin system